MASRLLRPTNLALANAIKKVTNSTLGFRIFCFIETNVLHKRVDIAHTAHDDTLTIENKTNFNSYNYYLFSSSHRITQRPQLLIVKLPIKHHCKRNIR